MRILIYGAGVIGSFYASRFAKAGLDVTVLARGQRLKELQGHGLWYRGKTRTHKVEVKTISELKPDDRYQFIFLTVRENQVEKALEDISKNKSPNVVTMINTIKPYGRWEKICGKGRIIPAFPGAGGCIEGGILDAQLLPRAIQPTTFGVGFGNFFGGSLSQLAGGVGQISVAVTGGTYRTKIPGLSKIPVIGDVLFSYGFMTYFGIILAILISWFMYKSRKGLNLRAVGESPATADAAGINVTLYKYLATIIGGAISGLGGLYFVMEYSGGTWTNNGFGDRGWLAIALVIFALWKPINAIWGSFLFGALYILYLYIPGLGRSMQEIFKMLPYLVTIVVLIFTSFRKKKEYQPPESLGNSYFREER